jgi:hypothetical protein
LDIIGRIEAFSENRFQVSAPPPAKKTAGQIEKETDERRTSNIERPTSNNEFGQFY